ncbi:MAG: sigma-70 family RNA polymerase sigma factor [Gammaproteobacteria bacterium]|nr:MAG: sigma-70 family RNA polymerase sigma factor [Gammaproteobacteria bacterium]
MSLRRQIVQWIPHLRRYARGLLLDRELADDLVQETLLRALAREQRWRPGSDLRAWLFTLMHNLFVSDYRRRCRSPLVAVDSLPERAAAGQADSDCRVRDVEQALQYLPPSWREVLLLVSLEGLSYTEVARVLGIPVGTVMSRLHRARQRLAQLLEEGQPRLEVVHERE